MDAQISEDTWLHEGASVSHKLKSGGNDQTFSDWYMRLVVRKILIRAAILGRAGTVLLLRGLHSWKIQGLCVDVTQLVGVLVSNSKRRQHEGEKGVFGSHVLLLRLNPQITADEVC